jgi:hypothetical protein
MLRHRSIAVLAAAAGLLAATAGPAAAEQFVVDGPFTVKLGRCDANVRGSDVRIQLGSRDVARLTLPPHTTSLELENILISNYSLTAPERRTCGL